LNASTHTDPRLLLVRQWLSSLPADLGVDVSTLRPASSDASFRRYFRVDSGAGTRIVMDAPPPQEDCRPFLHVAGLLHGAQLNVPRALASDLERGLLLLTDLGPSTYYQVITGADVPGPALQQMYRDAIAALVRMQQASVQGLAPFSEAKLLQELTLFTEWYVPKHCQAALTPSETDMLTSVFADLARAAARQPAVFVHRDFHSPNLMVSDGPRHGPNPGVIDFQDALAGPPAYDLASLVMDARTTWEEAQQIDWAVRYWEMARAAGLPVHADFAEFHRAYEWMSLQRNLRILGVFARLSLRDGKQRYLDHMPRVSAYVRQVAGRYGRFLPLMRLLDRLENRQAVSGYTF
jgi:aminoglycoside/choline kinase family phosphotransferase